MALTYKTAGVDITKGNKLIDIIKPAVRTTFRQEVLTDIGSFSALFKLNLFIAQIHMRWTLLAPQ